MNRVHFRTVEIDRLFEFLRASDSLDLRDSTVQPLFPIVVKSDRVVCSDEKPVIIGRDFSVLHRLNSVSDFVEVNLLQCES